MAIVFDKFLTGILIFEQLIIEVLLHQGWFSVADLSLRLDRLVIAPKRQPEVKPAHHYFFLQHQHKFHECMQLFFRKSFGWEIVDEALAITVGF